MTTLGHPPELPQPRKPRGCFFYGCITAVVLGVVFGVGGFFAVRYALDKVAEVAEQYTDTAPMPLPESPMPAGEYRLLERRVSEFRAAVDENQEPTPLVLTSDDLNALIANHPSLTLLRGRVHVSLQGDRIDGEIALPLDEFVEHLPGLSQLKGRYLNGKATLKIVLVDEILFVSLRSLEVKGESLPPEVMANLRSQNLVGRNQAGPEIERLKGKIRSIDVEDGKLMIVARPGK